MREVLPEKMRENLCFCAQLRQGTEYSRATYLHFSVHIFLYQGTQWGHIESFSCAGSVVGTCTASFSATVRINDF